MTARICPFRSGPVAYTTVDGGADMHTETLDAPCVEERCRAWDGGGCLLIPRARRPQ